LTGVGVFAVLKDFVVVKVIAVVKAFTVHWDFAVLKVSAVGGAFTVDSVVAVNGTHTASVSFVILIITVFAKFKKVFAVTDI
jgi:hypothetical protein